MPPVVAGAAETECSVHEASSGVEKSVGFDIVSDENEKNNKPISLTLRPSGTSLVKSLDRRVLS